MASKKTGNQTFVLCNPPSIAGHANVVGQKEGAGPLKNSFDLIGTDDAFGERSWEKAEVEMQKRALSMALEKAKQTPSVLDFLFAGDLLNQCISAGYAARGTGIPFFGLYGACSTMREALSLGAMCVNAGYADWVLALVSSHYATAEKQFRFPLGYGNQRAQSATWTVTGCGAVVLESGSEMKREGACSEKNSETAMKQAEGGGNGMGRMNHRFRVAVTGITTGKLVDMGTKDSMNMGAAMAPAAWNTICRNFEDFGVDASYYDRIITGDLGAVGQKALLDFMKSSGHDITGKHMDCGLEIYDRGEQDVHSGGSGCGCSAVTLCAHILPKLMRGEWNRVLFVPTGALLSTVSYNEGQSIPGIAHAVMLERMEV